MEQAAAIIRSGVAEAQTIPTEKPPPDPEAFRAVFEEFFPRLRAYYLSHGFAPSDADDLSQSTLLNVYRAWNDFRAEGALESWIFSAARNAAYDARRRRARRPEGGEVDVELPDPAARPDAVAAEKQTLGRVVESLRALPSRMRACLLLRVQRDLSYKDIGERLGISERTVRVQVWMARRRLRGAAGVEVEP